MKKFFAIGILLIFILAFSVTAFAEEPKIKEYNQAVLYADGTFEVTEHNFSTLINIPWEDEKSLIRKVIFSSSTNVTAIPKRAFNGCVNLTEIIIPSSVTSIDTGAFNNCNALASITIPDSVTSISDRAFSDCNSLSSVTFGENSKLNSIGIWAFKNCDALVSIAIPDSVVSIGERAFNDCDSLSSVTFGENSKLNSIGNWAFNQCKALVSIAIPDSVTSIGDSAFSQCNALTEINYKGSAEKWNSIAKGMNAIPNGVKINHTGSCADENTDHVCGLCGEEVGIHADGDKDHFCDYGCSVTFETHEEAYKSHSCDYCGAVVSNCKDDDGNHICDVCDMELAHDYPKDWKADGNGHWHECSCGKKKDEAVHTGGTATCSKKAVCETCGYEYGNYNQNNHDYGRWVRVYEPTETEEGLKVKTCRDCGKKIYADIKPLNNDGIEELGPSGKSENDFNPNTGAPVFEPFALISVFAVGAAIFGKRR